MVNPVEYLDGMMKKMKKGDQLNVTIFLREYANNVNEALTITDDTFLCYVCSTNTYINGDICIWRSASYTIVEKRV